MRNVYFLLTFATASHDRAGAIGVKHLMRYMKYSRSQINRILKEFLDEGLIVKMGHGQYVLAALPSLQHIGYVTISPIEFFAYHSKLMERDGLKGRKVS